ncbi:MAG: hypothetical protein R3F19_25720 [Verrucomicrobiales bacterium]|nr:hypothetical protein [Verrucomicrobiae bacterium]
MKRPKSPVPAAAEFFVGPGTDAAYAWERFGGKSLSEAYLIFMECPECYGEDFGWILPKAFDYYFPIIDKYLREIDVNDEEHWTELDGLQAWIFGCRVQSQFHWKDGTKPSPALASEIAELSTFVQTNAERYSNQADEQARIREAWLKVDHEIAHYLPISEQGACSKGD